MIQSVVAMLVITAPPDPAKVQFIARPLTAYLRFRILIESGNLTNSTLL
jgi:hypothetical protein